MSRYTMSCYVGFTDQNGERRTHKVEQTIEVYNAGKGVPMKFRGKPNRRARKVWKRGTFIMAPPERIRSINSLTFAPTEAKPGCRISLTTQKEKADGADEWFMELG